MMNRTLKILVPVLMLYLSSPAAGTPSSEYLLPYNGGDITVQSLWKEGRYQGATAKGQIAAPPEIVWRIITDYNRSSEFMPNIIESMAVRREGNRVWTRTVVKAGLLKATFFALSTEREETGELEWKQLKGPFTTNHGRWKIEPSGHDSTMVTYQCNLDHRMMPEWIRHHLIRKSLPQLFEAIRKRAGFLQGKAETTGKNRKENNSFD